MQINGKHVYQYIYIYIYVCVYVYTDRYMHYLHYPEPDDAAVHSICYRSCVMVVLPQSCGLWVLGAWPFPRGGAPGIQRGHGLLCGILQKIVAPLWESF